MNAVRKTILFLAAAAVLLGVPLTAAVENDDIQAPPAINLAAASAATSQSARGTVPGECVTTVRAMVGEVHFPIEHSRQLRELTVTLVGRGVDGRKPSRGSDIHQYCLQEP
jgi:hypothetical protein